MTREELQNLTQEELRKIAIETSRVIKQYIDENTISPDEVEKIEKANKLAESLLGIFDENEDGAISKEEFINKLNEIYATLESVKEIKTQITDLATKLGATQKELETLKGDIKENYFTKSDVEAIVRVDVDSIVSEVRSVFYPETVAEGDGAVE